MFGFLSGSTDVNINEANSQLETWVSEQLSSINQDTDLDAFNENFKQGLNDKMVELGLKKDDSKKSTLKSVIKGFGYTMLALASIIMPQCAGITLEPVISKIGGGIDAKIMSRLGITQHVSSQVSEHLDKNIFVDQGLLDRLHNPPSSFPKPLNTIVANDKEFSGKPQVNTVPQVYDSQQERTNVEAAARMITPSQAIDMIYDPSMTVSGINSDPFSFLAKEALLKMKMDKKEDIEVNKESLKEMDGDIAEELYDVINKYDSFELPELNKVLNQLREKFYNKFQILDDSNPYGGINYHILKNIIERDQNGKSLTELEQKILGVAEILMDGPSYEAVYRPLYYKADWDGKSPYLTHFNKFIYDLKNILKKFKIIDKTSDKELETIVKGQSIRYIRSDMNKVGKKFNLWEKSLDLWFINIENEILTSLRVSHKMEAICAVQALFNHYYQISGWMSKNPIYRDARHMIFKIGAILLNEGLINENKEGEIENFLGYSCGWLYKGIKFDQYKLWPTKGDRSPIVSLRKAIENSVRNVLSNSKVNQINDLINKFEDKIKRLRSIQNSFQETDELLNGGEMDETQEIDLLDNVNTLREKLILDLLVKMTEYSDNIIKYTSIRGLSRLLFGKEKYITENFWRDRSIDPSTTEKIRTVDRRPELYTLLKIKFMTQIWKTSDFKKEGMNINTDSLNQLRLEVYKKIDEFIFRNPYEKDYVSRHPKRGFKYYSKDYLKPESDLITWIWMTYAIRDDNPKLSFQDIADKKILSSWLTSYLSKGDRNIPKSGLKKFASEFVSFYREALDGTHKNRNIKISQAEKLIIYKTAFEQIFKYMKVREINYLTNIVRRFMGKNPDYHDLWGDSLTKSYHNVLLFARQLGFDPLTFMPLKGGEGGIFELKPNKVGKLISDYIRHHLDNNKKKSILLQDLLLTSNKIHAKYEKLIRDYGVEYSYKLNDAFNELVSFQGYIDEEAIVKIFNKYGVIEVYNEFYKANKDLKKNLEKFNLRKNDMQALGIDGFMETMKGDYPVLYDRLYLNVKDDNYKFMMFLVSDGSVDKLFSTIDESSYYFGSRKFSDLFAIDYYFSLHPDLVDYYNFSPHIFKYWFGD